MGIKVQIASLRHRFLGHGAAVIGVLLFAACGSPKVSPHDPQSIYLDAVKHRNDVLSAIQAQPAPSWTDLRSLSATMAEAEQEELSKLVAATWPADAQPAINALEGEIRLALPYWHAAATAQTPSEVESDINKALVYCGGPAAGEVRDALGLPPAS
jgi:hypothetical protein